MMTVIILSFQHIIIIPVINSLNNSKGNYSNNNNSGCSIAITHRTDGTTSSKIPSRNLTGGSPKCQVSLIYFHNDKLGTLIIPACVRQFNSRSCLCS